MVESHFKVTREKQPWQGRTYHHGGWRSVCEHCVRQLLLLLLMLNRVMSAVFLLVFALLAHLFLSKSVSRLCIYSSPLLG